MVDRGTCDEETKEPEGLPVLETRATSPGPLLRICPGVCQGSKCFTRLLRRPDAGDGPQDARSCLCDGRRSKASDGGSRGSLLYGELLPRGVHKALDARIWTRRGLLQCMTSAAARGKLLYKPFCSSPISNECMVWSLSLARFHVAERALLKTLAARDDCDAHSGSPVPPSRSHRMPTLS